MMANSALFRVIVGPVLQEMEEDETPVLYRRNSPLFRPEQLPVEEPPQSEFEESDS